MNEAIMGAREQRGQDCAGLSANGVHEIVVPVDGSHRCERVLPLAIALARVLNAEVALVRTYEQPQYVPSGSALLFTRNRVSRAPLHQASLYLARLEETLRARAVRVRSLLYQWPLADALLACATGGPNDLLILLGETPGAHGESSDTGTIQQVLRETRSAVLLLTVARTDALVRSEMRGPHMRMLPETVTDDGQELAVRLGHILRGSPTPLDTKDVDVVALNASGGDGHQRTEQIERALRLLRTGNGAVLVVP